MLALLPLSGTEISFLGVLAHGLTTSLGQSLKVNQAFTFDASTECQESRTAALTTEIADHENVVRNKLKPRRQWKWKSNLSATVILTFIQTYTEKREKAEEERLNLLREMKYGKKEFFWPISEDFKKQVIEEIWKEIILSGFYASKFRFAC